MKIEILKDNLIDASQIISRISNKNLSLPVLSCVVVTATPSKTTLKATNLDLSVEIQIKAKVLEEGVVAIPAHIFNQLISTTTDQKITLQTKEENHLELIGSHGKSKINTLDVSEFPTLPFVKEGQGVVFQLPTKELIRSLKSVYFSASTTGIRPELSSVFIKISEGVLTTTATDSFRLSEMKTPIKLNNSFDPILIPARNIPEIIKIITNSDVVEVRVDENQVTFITNNDYITSRIVDGVFPDYQVIIPKTFTTTTTVLTGDLLKTLKKVSVFTDNTGQVEFAVSPTKKEFLLKAKNNQVGEIVENLDAVFEGEDNILFFNIKYILDALSVVTADSVVLKFSGQGKPLVVSEIPEKGFVYLVMPMNK